MSLIFDLIVKGNVKYSTEQSTMKMQHQVYQKKDGSFVQSLTKDGICVSEFKTRTLYKNIVTYRGAYLWFLSARAAEDYTKDKKDCCLYQIYDNEVIMIKSKYSDHPEYKAKPLKMSKQEVDHVDS